MRIYFLTQDTADGDFAVLRAKGEMTGKSAAGGAFAAACRDPRVWALFVIYGACFGMELTIDNIAALYFTDNFHLGLTAAGVVAGSFGMMNIFARALGGIVSDRCHKNWGLRGRALMLGGTIFCEGLALMLFSQMSWLPLAIATMMFTGLFIKMSNGATYAVVPFVNRKALGAVAGVVGAGGNVGAVMASFLFKGSMPWTVGASGTRRPHRCDLPFRCYGAVLRSGRKPGRTRNRCAAFGPPGSCRSDGRLR